jgi:hypothetical protein
MRYYFVSVLILVLMLIPNVQLFSQTTVTGEIRPRFEYRHGYQSPLDSAGRGAVFTTQRTRLNFNYASDKLTAAVSVQDIRIWGSAPQQVSSYPDAPTFLHRAWAQYYFTSRFSMKAGRQELSYDDERIFGAVNWTQQGRAHDALLLIFSDTVAKFTSHIGLAYNSNSVSNTAIPYTVSSSYKEMQYLWLNKTFGDLGASLLFLNLGAQSTASVTSTRFSHTTGTHLSYNKNKLNSNLKLYYQTGTDASKRDLKAYMGGFDINYNVTQKFNAGIGVEHLSGQSQTDTAKSYTDVNHVFNPYFGTNHKFNGYMDYYFAGNGHGNAGLTNVYLKFRYKTDKWWASLHVHQFMAAADVLDQKELNTTGKYTAMDANLGNEIDLEFAYTFTPAFTIQLGYAHYIPTETISHLKNVRDYKGDGYTGETANWAYVMLIFKPAFIK